MGEEFAPPEFLTVGHILAPWGTKGEVKVQVLTDFPERFTPGELVYVNGRPLEIESSRAHKQQLLVKLATIDSIQDAEKLRDHDLSIPRSEIHALPPDEYYAFQLIGLRVTTADGEYLGRIADIMITAGNDVYVVKGDSGEILIPAIEDVVKSIDLDKREVVIEAIEGLF
ncbi:MAG TPA: ribosome maturation factor RimM [Dehalococcoidia bacterium]|nr:ribosome maturation factor RimM [Dehalococcoidia bacterium]